MATAKKTPVPVLPFTVDLHLDQQEAETLMAILNRVGGPMHNSRRKYADSIFEALRSLHISEFTDDIDSKQRAIYFIGI